VRAGDETFVRARHILLRSPTEDDAIRDRLAGIRDQVAAGADFADMARRHSDDGSAANGGDLGWFGRGQMVEPFERGAFDAAVGEVVGPIQTQFGYHLIQVLGRTDREVQISDMALPVRADVATLNRMQEQLEDLRFYAEETGNFDAEATRLGLTVEQVQVEAGQQFLPGLGGSRAIMNFLETTRRGRISDVIELDDVFVVVRVDEIVSEGYRPFDEVRAELEPRVYVEKKKEVLSERLRRAIARTDFDGLPQALGVEKQTATGLSFNSSVIPGLGREPRFIGTALALEEGGTSGVVAGENAVYVIRVTAVHEPLPITDAERQRIREQLEQSRRSQVQNEWLTSLREKARVDDRRSRFLQ
jgi:peptidyl-prolyl cis-trans isomerase D